MSPGDFVSLVGVRHPGTGSPALLRSRASEALSARLARAQRHANPDLDPVHGASRQEWRFDLLILAPTPFYRPNSTYPILPTPFYLPDSTHSILPTHRL